MAFGHSNHPFRTSNGKFETRSILRIRSAWGLCIVGESSSLQLSLHLTAYGGLGVMAPQLSVMAALPPQLCMNYMIKVYYSLSLKGIPSKATIFIHFLTFGAPPAVGDLKKKKKNGNNVVHSLRFVCRTKHRI